MKAITLSLLILTLLLVCIQIPVTLASPDIYLKNSPASGVLINPGKLMDFKAPTQVDPAYLTTSSGVEYYWYSSPYVGTIPGPKAHGFHLYYTADTVTTITVTAYLAVQSDGSGIPPLVSSKTHPLETASTVTHVTIPDVITIPETKLNGERIKLSISSEDPITIYYDSIATPSVLNTVPSPPPPPLNSNWAHKPPTIDGIFSNNEWVNPQLELIPPDFPIHALVYIMNDVNHLYVCVDAADAAFGDYTADTSDAPYGDYCVLAFDVGNDGVWTQDVDAVFILGYFSGIVDIEHDFASSSTPGHTYQHCFASGNLHAGLDGAIGFGTSPNAPSISHRIYEFKIPLNLIGASPGSTVGFSSPESWDSLPYDYDGGNSPRHNIWPIGAVWSFLDNWGDIILASQAPVGGILIPVSKTEVLAPCIALAGLIAAASTLFIIKRRKD